jgi:PPOX class probable F420-dependent enzyme
MALRKDGAMADLSAFTALVPEDHGLVVVSTTRADGTIQSSVVNAGVIDHPVDGHPVVAFVSAGAAQRLKNLRARPRATVVLRAGWRWAGVEGDAELIGPDDPHDGVDDERRRLLLREIFTAAGGSHEDWDEYDRVMREEGRVAVLVDAERVFGSG